MGRQPSNGTHCPQGSQAPPSAAGVLAGAFTFTTRVEGETSCPAASISTWKGRGTFRGTGADQTPRGPALKEAAPNSSLQQHEGVPSPTLLWPVTPARPRPPRFCREDPAGSWMKGANLGLLHPSQPTASTSLPGLQARAQQPLPQQPRIPEGKNFIFPKRLPSRLKRGCSVKPASALSLFFTPIKSLAACLCKLYVSLTCCGGRGTSVPSGWPRGTCLHEDNGPS